MSKQQVIIVGAGLAGLCCGRRLHQAGVEFTILEAADDVGGRIRTDRFEGFLLDRGFQVLLTAYPECRSVLNYKALELHAMLPGALIRFRKRFSRLSDPWRLPGKAAQSLFSPVGSLGDKLKIAQLRRRLRRLDLDAVFATPEMTTLELLRELGFTERIVESFFRPFFGGVFLDPALATSSRMFEFVFKMFSEGEVAVPARGMEDIPRGIAAQLPHDSIRLGSRVERVESGRCRLVSGEVLQADRIVVAADGSQAAAMLTGVTAPTWNRTVCLYYDAPEPPIDEPTLLLDGDRGGPVNNVCALSQVCPTYAPADRALVSVSVVDDRKADEAALDRAVRAQLQDWFGPDVVSWRTLRQYRIPQALPALRPGRGQAPAAIRPAGVHVCGDHVESPSIQGAMVSGRKAAEEILDPHREDRSNRG